MAPRPIRDPSADRTTAKVHDLAPAQAAPAARSARGATPRLKFTHSALDALPAPANGRRVEYRDQLQPALLIRITGRGLKTFAAYGWDKGTQRPTRVTLGTYRGPADPRPRMTVDQARVAAAKALSKLAHGLNPTAEARAKRLTGATVREVLKAYVESRPANRFKPRSGTEYGTVLEEVAGDWLDRPLSAIRPETLVTRHASHTRRSPARADYFARVIRALWNFARAQSPATYADNPVAALNLQRRWNRVARRRSWIKPTQLPAWWQAVQTLRNGAGASAVDSADVFEMLLLTGLRPGEAAGLQWRYVDLREKTLEIPDPKNRHPHVLPLSRELAELLKRRQAARVRGEEFVFPAARGSGAFLKTTLHKYVRLVIAESGVQFMAYDLRRTFATIAESLDVSQLAVKRLMNHRTVEADVTAGYIGADVERLRRAMQHITDEIMRLVHAPDAEDAGSPA